MVIRVHFFFHLQNASQVLDFFHQKYVLKVHENEIMQSNTKIYLKDLHFYNLIKEKVHRLLENDQCF